MSTAELSLQTNIQQSRENLDAWVREALARLIHERYVVPASSGRRTQLVVAPFTIDDVRELWGIIGALEGYAVAIVAPMVPSLEP